jgi:DNA-directed RNA polymerase subunit N (RpoN/RPB10)
VRCPTCGRITSQGIEKWYKGRKEIENNPNMSKHEKEEAGAKLLDDCGYALRGKERVCCRQRIMGVIPYHEIVITEIKKDITPTQEYYSNGSLQTEL